MRFMRLLFLSEKKSTYVLQKVACMKADLSQMMAMIVKWLNCCQLSQPHMNIQDIIQVHIYPIYIINSDLSMVNYIW